jgi:putative transposase
MRGMEHDRPNDQNSVEAVIWAEGCRRYQAIRELLGPHRGRLSTCDVSDVARGLSVSRATLYRLIKLYRELGSVDALLPKRAGRRKGTRVLSGELERVIRTAIEEANLARPRPTLTSLVELVHARCLKSNLPLPHRRTIRARLATASKRELAEGSPAGKCVQV